jgi:hypothetical protein
MKSFDASQRPAVLDSLIDEELILAAAKELLGAKQGDVFSRSKLADAARR